MDSADGNWCSDCMATAVLVNIPEAAASWQGWHGVDRSLHGSCCAGRSCFSLCSAQLSWLIMRLLLLPCFLVTEQSECGDGRPYFKNLQCQRRGINQNFQGSDCWGWWLKLWEKD